ncbi:MAG TPA: PP2C family protein-serine/threonine phosphatase [Terracidiphilus sp.]|nr:PP2C family protein-serine/threonine phosphatase [Terracidiphilus sp.]
MRLCVSPGRVAALPILLALLTASCHGLQSSDPLIVRGLGIGSVPLGGQWSFHTGDNRAWASPEFDDSGWKTLDIARPWGDQGHWAYTGFAWYRRQIDFGDADQVSLFIPDVDCVYEIFWNGRRVGGYSPMPGMPGEQVVPPAVYRLTAPGSGLMAIRTWGRPSDTSLRGDALGFSATPRAANTEAAANLLRLSHYATIRTNLASFSLIPFYAGLSLLGFAIWIRNRNHKMILWLALYCFSLLLFIALNPSVGQVTFQWSPLFFSSPFHALNDVAFWYLLIYLLDLHRHRPLLRVTRILAIVALASAFCDSVVFSIAWSSTHVLAFQVFDAILTAGFSIPDLFPLVLVALAIRRGRLGFSRWMVAIAAAANEMYFVIWHTAVQGVRFTRFTLAGRMLSPVLSVFGVPVSPQEIFSTILILTILFAAYRYIAQEERRQRIIREELKSAQELQRVLIPQALPRLPGFAVTSAYQPAAELGGDFFQLVAVDRKTAVLVLGDVSGKGLKAAMTVSLIIGALRTLTDLTSQPDKILELLNRRLIGRLQHGFVTCLVIRLSSDGACIAASAGHPAPYVGDHEISLPPSMPLGLDPNAVYEKQPFDLRVGARLLTYTDGLIEARNRQGELFSFKRLERLISLQPDAKEAVETAVAFGQEDDITVLTVMRLEAGQRSSTSLQAPELEPAQG